MFEFFSRQTGGADPNQLGKLTAMDRSQAVIEFDPDGTIRSANENFLSAMGYELEEIVGKHHRMFVDPAESQSPEYDQFWRSLRAGSYEAAQFMRLTKAGKRIWIQASYNPILDADGAVTGVVKFATDVTAQKAAEAEAAGKVAAISRSQAVIEFSLDGQILDANENFLAAVGYDLHEIVGKHHRMFVENEYAASTDYAEFWAALSRGEYQAAAYKRIGKGGKVVWIQATYNPIFDAAGEPIKVIKFATEITAEKKAIDVLGCALGRLADGDLRAKIDDEFPGDLNTLKQAFNQSRDRLAGFVQEIRTAIGEVAAAAKEIASASADLATRTEAAASNLESTSLETEKLSAVVKENAVSSQNADRLAGDAHQTAKTGGEITNEAVAAMAEIKESSQKIKDIIAVIEEIAFQTNLLALNASVEAARAGEAGKGFAVVAQEVRSLAQRCAEAASSTKSLIQVSADHVGDGGELVSKAGSALDEIVTSIEKVAGIMRDISTASTEQANGVSSINQAVGSLEDMTQQNAAMVEETTAAAQALSDQASRLEDLMAVFQIEEGGMTTPQSRSPRAA